MSPCPSAKDLENFSIAASSETSVRPAVELTGLENSPCFPILRVPEICAVSGLLTDFQHPRKRSKQNSQKDFRKIPDFLNAHWQPAVTPVSQRSSQNIASRQGIPQSGPNLVLSFMTNGQRRESPTVYFETDESRN